MADPNDIAHLLRRTEFVARPARVAELAGGSLEAAVDDVLDIARNGDPQLPAFMQTNDADHQWDQYSAAYAWWVDAMVQRPRPFQEKMTLFWHGHFVSERRSVERNDLMFRQNQLYRSLALGNFRTLTQRMAIEPAMLIYLSNRNNVKGAPNENFARELMELFTLGVNSNGQGNYTEADVAAAARAWTGHNYNSTTLSYEFRANKHDNDPKTFFGTTKNWDGPGIIDEILRDNAEKRQIAARFIARKLWEFLAHPGPDGGVLDALAATFVDNDFELRPLLRALLLRPEFYSATARQGLLRTPTDFAVAICAQTNQPSSGLGLSWSSAAMGQELFNPPNVAGWKHNSSWINTSALSGRASVARRAVNPLRANNGFDDLYALSSDAAVSRVADYLGISPLSVPTRTALVNAYTAERTGPKGNAWWAVTNLLTAAMLTPEFNLA